MGSLSSIGIDNNLASRQSCVTMRTTNNKLTRGIYIVFDIQPEEVKYLLRVDLLFHTGNEDMDHIVLDAGEHGLIVGKLVMLGRDDDGVDALRNARI